MLVAVEVPLLDVEGGFQDVREQGQVVFHPLLFLFFDQFPLPICYPVVVQFLLPSLDRAGALKDFGMFLAVVMRPSVVLDCCK